MKKIKLALVDDHQLFRQGMMSLLIENNDFEIVFEAKNGQELIDKTESGIVPDVVLLDIEMPVLDGIQVLEYYKNKSSNIKFIIITMHTEEKMIVHLLDLGANGFLLKSEDIENVIDAIYSVVETGYYFNDQFPNGLLMNLMTNEIIVPEFKDDKLSERDISIIKLICKELTNKEIAIELSMNSRTVEGARERILRKIGARNVAGIVLYAFKNRLIN